MLKLLIKVHSVLKYYRSHWSCTSFRFSVQNLLVAVRNLPSKTDQRIRKMSQSDGFVCLEWMHRGTSRMSSLLRNLLMPYNLRFKLLTMDEEGKKSLMTSSMSLAEWPQIKSHARKKMLRRAGKICVRFDIM